MVRFRCELQKQNVKDDMDQLYPIRCKTDGLAYIRMKKQRIMQIGAKLMNHCRLINCDYETFLTPTVIKNVLKSSIFK